MFRHPPSTRLYICSIITLPHVQLCSVIGTPSTRPVFCHPPAMCLCVLLSPCHVSLCSVIPLPRAPVFCQPPSTRPCVLSTPFHAPLYSVISLPHVFVICPPPSMCFCVLSSPCHASLCSVLPLPCVSVFCCRKFILRVPELPPPPLRYCITSGREFINILYRVAEDFRLSPSACVKLYKLRKNVQ